MKITLFESMRPNAELFLRKKQTHREKDALDRAFLAELLKQRKS